MENTQFSKPNSKEWDANSFHQDNQMRVAAALNHGTYGDSSGVSLYFFLHIFDVKF